MTSADLVWTKNRDWNLMLDAESIRKLGAATVRGEVWWSHEAPDVPTLFRWFPGWGIVAALNSRVGESFLESGLMFRFKDEARLHLLDVEQSGQLKEAIAAQLPPTPVLA